jgi:hypothetical protein
MVTKIRPVVKIVSASFVIRVSLFKNQKQWKPRNAKLISTGYEYYP